MFGIDNPDTLLRPWDSLKQFSEELYAAFRRGKAADKDSRNGLTEKSRPETEPLPPTRESDYQPQPQPRPLRVRPVPQFSYAQQQAAAAPVVYPYRNPTEWPEYFPRVAPVQPWTPTPLVPSVSSAAPQADQREQTSRPQPQPSPQAPRGRPIRETQEQPRRPQPQASSTPDLQAPTPERAVKDKLKLPDKDPSKWPDLPVEIPPGAYPAVAGSGTASYMGKVTGFNGGGSEADSTSTIEVQLYSSGPNSDPDTTGPNGEDGGKIIVGILYFLGSDTIPSGYWVTGIVDTGNGYWVQVPVWS